MISALFSLEHRGNTSFNLLSPVQQSFIFALVRVGRRKKRGRRKSRMRRMRRRTKKRKRKRKKKRRRKRRR
jgi:hypothetical protein